MTNKNKKFLIWFVGFGAIKARIIHFLFLCIIFLAFFAGLAFVLSGLTHTSFAVEWKKNIPFSFFFFVCAPFVSWRFYDVALMRIKEYKSLEKKGLTKEDLVRIAFVKRWAIIRKIGIIRYCFFDGGVIAGMLLLFPISFLMFNILKSTDALLSNLGSIALFIGKNMLLSYIIGLLIFRFRWSYNQRKFMRLTNPVN